MKAQQWEIGEEILTGNKRKRVDVLKDFTRMKEKRFDNKYYNFATGEWYLLKKPFNDYKSYERLNKGVGG